MELPLILGLDKTEYLIILYSFIQQHVLFEAIAGKLNGDIAFLNDMANTFAMLGLLILIFSPSLWKMKYVVSWFALFIILVLGGSLGPLFGYSFIQTKSYSYAPMNRPVFVDDSVCKPYQANCTYLPGDQAVLDAQAEAGVKPYTGAEQAKDTIGNKTNADGKAIIEVDTNGFLKSININGFMPQVIILYVTNKLRYSLQAAMNDLASRDELSKRKEAIDLMQHSQITNDQVSMLTDAFITMCKAPQGLTYADTLSLNTTEAVAASNNLEAQKLSPSSMLKFIVNNQSNKEEDASLLPMLYIAPEQVLSDGTTTIDNEAVVRLLSDPNMTALVQHYTLNRAIDGAPSLSNVDPATNPKRLRTLKETPLNDIKKMFIARKDSKYDTGAEPAKLYQYLNSLPSNVTVSLVAPLLNIPKSSVTAEKNKVTQSNTQKIQSGYSASYVVANEKAQSQKNDVDVKMDNQLIEENINDFDKLNATIDDCGDLLLAQNALYVNSVETNIGDIKNQIIQQFQKTGSMSQAAAHVATQMPELAARNLANRMSILSKDLQASTAFVNALGRSMTICQNLTNKGETCDDAVKVNSQLTKIARKAGIENHIKGKINDKSTVKNPFNSGIATDLADTVGREFVEIVDGPLAFFKSIGTSFEKGAYSAVLPIVKNIILAFIIVLTPILLIMGLLVPAWAPGVIATVLIALLYIKSVDVTIVLVDGMINSIDKIFDNLLKQDVDNNDAYNNFMDIIWGMAYMASFAITAFLMFAAGNTKAVMSKMAGLDGTVKSTSKELYENGWKAVKSGVGLAAPGMGNTMISSTGAFNAITGTVAGAKNLAAGGVASTGQEWSHAIQSKQISGKKDSDKVKEETSTTYSAANGGMETSVMMAEYLEDKEIKAAEHHKDKALEPHQKDLIFKEQKNAAGDKNAIKLDAHKSKQEARDDKNTRNFQRGEPDILRMDKDHADRSQAFMAAHGIADDDRFSDTTVSMPDPSNPNRTIRRRAKGARTQMSKDLVRSNLKAFNYDKITDSAQLATARDDARRLAAAMTNELSHQLKTNSTTSLTNDGGRSHTFNANREELKKNIAERLAAKKGSPMTSDKIEQALNGFLGKDASGKFTLNDKLATLQKAAAKPGRPKNNGDNATYQQGRKKGPGKGRGKKGK